MHDAMASGIFPSDSAVTPTGGPPEILSFGLSVIFCGLNPALSAAREGHNFSNRSNRFWRVLHLAGFTPRLLRPEEEREILNYGLGLTAAVTRPTRTASEIKNRDYIDGAPALESKIRAFGPANMAFLAKAAYMAIGNKKHVGWGRQPESFGNATVWVLPNPSGLNRAFDLAALTEHYHALQTTVTPVLK